MSSRYFNNPRLTRVMFGSKITQGNKKPRSYFQEESQSNRWLLLFLPLCIFLIVASAKLFELQLIKGAYFRQLAEGNRIRRIPIKAPRGEIFDRNGVALARNIPIYKIATFSNSGVVTKTDSISREEAIKLQSGGDSEEANRLLIEVGREYTLTEAAAHVVGYVNEASEKEVGQRPDCPQDSQKPSYQVSDLIGRMGVEEQYECLLRGENGEELIEVDARGRLVRRLGRKDPTPGTSIKLTIYSALQRAAFDALTDAPNEKATATVRESGGVVKGALVAQNPTNGNILALVSTPSFDPNNITADYAKWVQDPNLPFFNRAISGAYHPGSTFKIITSTAGLEEGKIEKDFEYVDTGEIKVGEFSFKNWYFLKYGKGEGSINLARAIARSTDTFFYKVGEFLRPTRLADWATTYGLGRRNGIDLPGEVAGLIPTPEWKEKTKGERWFLGNTYHMSIGQGDVAATPLQISSMTSVVANGGNLCVPRVWVGDGGGKCKNLGIKDSTLEVVKEGMLGACSPGGTAGVFFNFKPQTSCKTGTAQTISEKTHAWFTSYAPAEVVEEGAQSAIVVTAIVEDGGEGSVVAAPVVKKVYQEWFK